MSFKYDLTANQQTPTSDSKVVLCKSFKIDIAAGSGFTTATSYDLGWLPKDAQVIGGNQVNQTAVSGGTVSVATLAITVGGNAVTNAANVFASGIVNFNALQTYYNGVRNSTYTTDQVVQYTPTLTGAGATAGVIYVNIFYVV